jgi:hypothetical protein
VRIQERVKDSVSSASNDDYGGVLCRSHGDEIPLVMTSLVCEKPTSSSVSVPMPLCIGVMYIHWQTAELVPAVTFVDKVKSRMQESWLVLS